MIERKYWAEGHCVEHSTQKIYAECSTPFPMPGFFSCNRTFFRRKEVAQIFIFHFEGPAPEAVPPVRLLDGSNLERKIRSLGSIPSNIERNYHLYHGCGYLPPSAMVSIHDLQSIYNSAIFITKQGATASIAQKIFNTGYIPNQEVGQKAAEEGIKVLTVGNANDLLWRSPESDTPLPIEHRCKDLAVGIPDFTSTQQLTTHANFPYGGVFVSGDLSCISYLQKDDPGNHFDVLNNSPVEQALLDFLQGNTITTITPVF